MRSELIFKALAHEPNRYQLVRLIAKGTRKMHRPNTRLPETMNAVIEHFHSAGPRNTPKQSPVSEALSFETVQVERRAA